MRASCHSRSSGHLVTLPALALGLVLRSDRTRAGRDPAVASCTRPVRPRSKPLSTPVSGAPPWSGLASVRNPSGTFVFQTMVQARCHARDRGPVLHRSKTRLVRTCCNPWSKPGVLCAGASRLARVRNSSGTFVLQTMVQARSPARWRFMSCMRPKLVLSLHSHFLHALHARLVLRPEASRLARVRNPSRRAACVSYTHRPQGSGLRFGDVRTSPKI